MSTCHMGGYSVTCYLKQVNVPTLTPARQVVTLLVDGWKTGWLVIHRDSLPVCRQSHISSIATRLGVKLTTS